MKKYFLDFKGWDEFLGNKIKKKVCHKTEVIRDNFDIISIYYWACPVVSIYRNGNIVLNNNGYNTPTTKRRLNQLTPYGFQVFQKDFKWYASNINGEVVEFKSGLKIDINGNFII